VYWLQRSVQALHRMLHVTNPYRYDRSDVDSCNICFEIFATSGLLVVRKYMKFACLLGLCFRLHGKAYDVFRFSMWVNNETPLSSFPYLPHNFINVRALYCWRFFYDTVTRSSAIADNPRECI